MRKITKNVTLFIMIFMMILSNGNIALAAKIEYSDKSVAQIDKVNFYNLTTKDGLSNNIITDIYQDSMGYMWIGTEDGLNKYNGNMVIEYNCEINNENTISSTCITSINEDKYGDIWVGTNSGLNIINRDENKVIRIEENNEDDFGLSDSVITSIYRDSNDTMWVGTANGLNRYDDKNNKFIKYYSDETDRSISNNYITDMEEDNLGCLWVCAIEGVAAIDINTYNIYNQRNEYNNTQYIYQLDKDNKGDLWSVTKSGILKSILGNYDIYNYQIDIGENLNNDIDKVLCDSNDNIWFASSNGLIRYTESDNRTKIYKAEENSHNSLLSNLITCLYEDRNGVIWIGTDNGVSILNTKQQFSNKINTIFENNEIYVSSVSAFLVDSDNDLWIGTSENGLILFDVDENKMIRFRYDENNENSLLSNIIKDIEEGDNGNIIVGTEKGINVINKKTGYIYRYDEVEKRAFFWDKGLKILNDGQYIWVATMGGLFKWDDEAKEFINFNENFIEAGIKNYKIFDILQDESDENILWLAGDRNTDLIKFHKTEGIIKNYLLDLEDNLVSYNAINCIAGDDEGNIWIGTELGLNKFNIKEESFTRYSEKDGLSNNYINSIIVDDNKDIWIGTSDGLSKLIVSENRFINFTEIDGIYGSQFTKRAAYKTKEGHLLFGTTKGVVSFNPDSMEEVISKDDKVVLGNMWIKRALYTGEKDDFELKHNENSIAIEYFLPDYSKIGGITGLMSISWTQKVKLLYITLLANNSH